MRAYAAALVAVALLAIGTVVVLAQQPREPVGAGAVPPAGFATQRSPRLVCGMTLIPVDPSVDPRFGTSRPVPVIPSVQFAPSTAPPTAPLPPGPALPQVLPPLGFAPAPSIPPVPAVPAPLVAQPVLPTVVPPAGGLPKPTIRAIQPTICWP